MTCIGWGAFLWYVLVGTHFFSIPGSRHNFLTCMVGTQFYGMPRSGHIFWHALVGTQFYDLSDFLNMHIEDRHRKYIRYRRRNPHVEDQLNIFLWSSSLCHQTSWGHPMSRAVQEGCIASCVQCSLLPDCTHKSYLLRSTAISVSVPCYMWILYIVDLGISTSSMVFGLWNYSKVWCFGRISKQLD